MGSQAVRYDLLAICASPDGTIGRELKSARHLEEREKATKNLLTEEQTTKTQQKLKITD